MKRSPEAHGEWHSLKGLGGAGLLEKVCHSLFPLPADPDLELSALNVDVEGQALHIPRNHL